MTKKNFPENIDYIAANNNSNTWYIRNKYKKYISKLIFKNCVERKESIYCKFVVF